MLSHVDPQGRPGMVDVGDKQPSDRRALALGEVQLPEELAALFQDGEYHSPKGPVFQTAIIAGTMAAKNCSSLIPFCHPLPIDGCRLEIELQQRTVTIRCEVRVHHRTGVEMEALTAVSVAALTVYDMCKAVTHAMVIGPIRLLEKEGGRHVVRQD
ncbi:MAG: cyclic pyranopterin monophosphate synthase MoaC [Calditrichaeota bacterium]|nr:cyclic pyranopterin monophosphate synthase MoaC [Candidatus Cloacimonadota bacterium]MCB1046607.1 cyclic pyranopterin monophosphate synthase MoaC [Calditrichota bacterium]